MQIRHASGPGASAVKYDILTALLAMAAQDGGTKGRLALRLSLLMTARYNWRAGTFAVGQREIARLWGVTERTAKRDLAQLRTLGWIAVLRPAARGRVATHAIAIETILADSMARWPSVGPDFAARMTGRQVPEATSDSNVVPFQRDTGDTAPLADDPWGRAARILRDQDPALFQAWFARLRMAELCDGRLQLIAPSGFVASYVSTHLRPIILAAMARSGVGVRSVDITT